MKKRKTKKEPANEKSRLTQSPFDQRPPVLRFSPTAWAKLLFFRDRGDTEIGGFGVTSSDDLLYVEQFVTVPQTTTFVHVAFDDEAVADFFDQQVDEGRRPQQFARIWLHSHPGDCPLPSAVDEETLQRCFGQCDWSVMFIIARDGSTYCRLRFNAGPGGEVEIPVRVDYSKPFPASDPVAWEQEYQQHVRPEPSIVQPNSVWPDEWSLWEDESEWPLDDLVELLHEERTTHEQSI